jgi:peroxiredoxin
MLKPRQPVPALDLPLVNGAHWSLAEQRPQHFTLVVFYRGLHCPVCRAYLGELHRLLDEFGQRGVHVIAASTDSAERAVTAWRDWHLDRLPIGHSMSLETARAWGLYLSAGRGKSSLGVEEPARFSEPGVFLVRPDGTLYWAAVQTMPFARPRFDEMLKAIDTVLKIDYPARGEL